MSGRTQDIVFCVWPLWLSTTFRKCTHVVSCVSTSFPSGPCRPAVTSTAFRRPHLGPRDVRAAPDTYPEMTSSNGDPGGRPQSSSQGELASGSHWKPLNLGVRPEHPQAHTHPDHGEGSLRRLEGAEHPSPAEHTAPPQAGTAQPPRPRGAYSFLEQKRSSRAWQTAFPAAGRFREAAPRTAGICRLPRQDPERPRVGGLRQSARRHAGQPPSHLTRRLELPAWQWWSWLARGSVACSAWCGSPGNGPHRGILLPASAGRQTQLPMLPILDVWPETRAAAEHVQLTSRWAGSQATALPSFLAKSWPHTTREPEQRPGAGSERSSQYRWAVKSSWQPSSAEESNLWTVSPPETQPP